MTSDVWELFPYPTFDGQQVVDGSLLAGHPTCLACLQRPCAKDSTSAVGEPRTCRYGLTYARVDQDRLVIGIIATDSPSPTSKLKTRMRLEPDRRVKSREIRTAVDRAVAIGPGVVQDFARMKAELLQSIERSPEMHRALADELRRDFVKNLEQSHDFLQLVNLVHKYAEVLLAEKFPDLPAQDAAERLPSEGAIYFATQLMAYKLDALIFLREVNRAVGNEKKFRIHPFVLKYTRIYAWQAKEKNVAISVLGESFCFVEYSPEAIGAIVQGVLDNLVKYAPAGSKATIQFTETDDRVEVSFTSLGPRIDEHETSDIFFAGYRAAAARVEEQSGQGIGLAAAKGVSDVLGLGLRVKQDPSEDSTFSRRYETTFSFSMKRS